MNNNISWSGVALCIGTLSGAAYGLNHFQQAKQSTYAWGHRIVGVIECFPVIGAIAAIIDRLISSCFKSTNPTPVEISKDSPISSPTISSRSSEELNETETKTDYTHWFAKLEGVSKEETLYKAWIDEGSQKGYLKKIDGQGTILHYLAKKAKHLDLLKYALTKDIDLTVKDTIFNNTALMWSIANANNTAALDLINQLNTRHLDISCKSENTPLHLAIAKGYKNKSADGATLTHSNLEIIKALLEKGANPNLKNIHGQTPLHLACARRDFKMIEVLLENGADRDIVNNKGQLPNDLIKLTYEQASTLMKNTAYKFILDKKLHQSSEKKAKKLIAEAA